ncbi:MAG TPA: hypothetical protein VLU25_18255 [Acidobacteriota bacterium]|nr:hypothetical protein [Acidobacteriota bacterium]
MTKLRVVFLLIAAVLLLTACGGGEPAEEAEAGGDAATSGQEGSQDPSETPAEAPAEVETVKTEGETATLETPAEAPAGSAIQVSWTGPDEKNDYITVVEKGAAQGTHQDYTYTRRGSPLELRVSETPGEYEVRYVSNASKETLVSAPLTVTAVEATLEAPEQVGAGATFEVTWTGPDNHNDYITVVPADADEGAHEDYTYTRRGSPLEIRAAETPGDYEVRYVMAQSKRTLASIPIEVTAVEASLSAPEESMVEVPVEVTWTGPDNRNDYIAIVESGSPEGTSGQYTYTRRGNPLTVRGPETPGQYEIRYVLSQSKRTLASRPLLVKPISASLDAPEKAAPGATVEVSWTGPDDQGDFIAIAKPDAEANSYESRALSSAGNPATLFAPSEPGQYQIRYVRKREVLATRNLEVSAEQ